MVTKSIKSARHAQLLHLSIHIPDECIGSLDTPLFKVRFAYCHYSVVRDVINRQLIAMIHRRSYRTGST